MRMLKVFGSWWTVSLFALALLATYVSFTFSENPYERWMVFMFHSLPGIALYYGLIISVILGSIRIIIERISLDVPTSESITRMDVHAGLATAEEAYEIFRKGGFNTTKMPPEGLRSGVCLRKGRYSFLPGTVMRAGTVLFLIALFLSTHTRKTEEALLSEGKQAEMSGRLVSLDSVNVKLEDDYLLVGGKGTFEIDELSAVVRSDESKFKVTGGKPTSDDGRYYRIIHVGYHQPIQINGVPVEADVDVLPPGKAHVLGLPEGIGPVSFVLEPERIVKKGLLTGKIYNLQVPRYRLRLQAQEGKGAVAGLDGESHMDGYRILLGEPSLYVKVQSTYDPAVPWLYIGVVLTLVGSALMALRLFWYEKQLCAIDVGGKILAGYSEEFYKKWGIMKFREWIELEHSPAKEPDTDA